MPLMAPNSTEARPTPTHLDRRTSQRERVRHTTDQALKATEKLDEPLVDESTDDGFDLINNIAEVNSQSAERALKAIAPATQARKIRARATVMVKFWLRIGEVRMSR